MNIWSLIGEFFETSGIAGFFQSGGWMNLVMILVGAFFLVLAVVFKFEPYLLIPISFGIILTNIPGAGIFVKEVVLTVYIL